MFLIRILLLIVAVLSTLSFIYCKLFPMPYEDNGENDIQDLINNNWQ